ncbi:MAG: CapA family protein, partial [Chloroflexi bacterium]|nr:CapA family protein [Chloroflexota bacterium]
DTFELLGARGIAAVGAGENAAAARAPLLLERNGLRLAFLAYVDVPVEYGGFDARDWIAGPASPGVAWAEPGEIAAGVQAARAGADVVIVLLHAGLEGRPQPSPNQQAAARAAIDAGAALVIGSHPHVLQGVERYGGGLIAYSLGNFVFDGFGFPENYSAILSITLTRAGVTAYDWLPVAIENGLPRPATPAEAQEALARVQPAAP